MNNLKFDKDFYEYIVLGTGPLESIISASLATYKSCSANFEFERFYSGPLKTLSLKELELLHKIHQPMENNDLSIQDLRNSQIDPKTKNFSFDFNPNCDIDNFEKFISAYGFRGWNIDYQPRLIYSESNATENQVDLQIDNYCSFKTLKKIYFWIASQNKFTEVPIDKGGIFKSQHLSQLEKKSLFQFMNLAMRYCSDRAGFEKDNNSISDFEKDVYKESVDFLTNLKLDDEKLLNSSFVEFLRLAGVTSKIVIQLITYSIGNYYTSPFSTGQTKECMTTKEFLGRIYRFLRSLGGHGEQPYLYPIYGTGDITQVLSRVSAVYGSIFVVEALININSIEKCQIPKESQSDQKKPSEDDTTELDNNQNTINEEGYEIQFRYKDQTESLKCKHLVIGPEYRNICEKLLKDSQTINLDQISKDKNTDENNKYIEHISRYSIIAKIPSENNEILRDKLPFCAIIPESTIQLGEYTHEHPINIMVTGKVTQATPDDFLMCYVRLKEDHALDKEKRLLFVENILEKIKVLLNLSSLELVLNLYHRNEIGIQDSFGKIDETNQIKFLGDIDAYYDFEEAFEEGKRVVQEYLGKVEKLFKREEALVISDVEPKSKLENLLDDIESFSL